MVVYEINQYPDFEIKFYKKKRMHSIKNFFSPKTILFVTFSCCLFLYIGFRAYTLSFTHDESLSFGIVQRINTYFETPNNHMLNTLLMSVSSSLFGDSEFALRLPNMLAFGIYLFAWYYILKSEKSFWLTLIGLSLALINPFMIEFFALARGYGLSIGFLTLGLIFLIRNGFTNHPIPTLLKDFALSGLLISLATLSNLSVINILIGMLGIFTLKFIFATTRNPIPLKYKLIFLSTFTLTSLVLAYCIQWLLHLSDLNQLYFGASSIKETIDYFIGTFLYDTNYQWLNTFIKITVPLWISLGLFTTLKQKRYNSPLLLISLLLCILIVGLFTEHLFFGALYPIKRTALFIAPLIMLILFYSAQSIANYFNLKTKTVIPLALILLLALSTNFMKAANFNSCYSWPDDSHIKEVMLTLKEETKNQKVKATFSCYWAYEPTINYYINRWDMNLENVTREGMDTTSLFIYINELDYMPKNYTSVLYFSDDKSQLCIKSRKTTTKIR